MWATKGMKGMERQQNPQSVATARIQYPYAIDGDTLKHISEANAQRHYSCPGCNQRLSPVLGSIRQHHFRHLPEAEECSPSNALHSMAQRLIQETQLKAQKAGTPYECHSLCEDCSQSINQRDIAEQGAVLTLEDTRAITGARPDVVVSAPSGEVIIEVVVTHDLEEALAVSDRVAVMRAGRIVQVDTPRTLYERPASVFVARFLGRANILHGTVRAAGSDQAGPLAAAGTPDGADSPVSAGAHRRLLETDIGLLPYDRPAVPGERGAVLIRPERIDLIEGHTAARSGRHSLRGTLRDVSFRGIAALATVLVGATTLQVLVTTGRTLPAVDSTVTISFDPPGAVVPLLEDEP